MEEYKFIKIRESKMPNMYELWDSISGKLFGIDEFTKSIIVANIEVINDSKSLQSMLDFLCDRLSIKTNDDYVFEKGQDGVIIINKTNDFQFVANEIVYDIILAVNENSKLSDIICSLEKIYDFSGDNKLDLINCIIQLVSNNILYIY